MSGTTAAWALFLGIFGVGGLLILAKSIWDDRRPPST